MDIRNGKMIIGKAGGTAGKESITCKVSIPSKWVRELNIDENNRDITLSFDGDKIVIAKKETVEDFLSFRKAQGNSIKELRYYSGSTLTTVIYADYSAKDVRIVNKLDNPAKTAFGENLSPTWSDYEKLLRSRCIDEYSPRLKDYLMSIGLKQYDPVAIIMKSKGRLMTDDKWLSITDIK